MSKRQLRADDVEGFMLAVWDSLEDLQKDYGVLIGVGMAPSRQRGHLVFRAKAYQRQQDGTDKAVAASECVWPTHYSTSVHALLYSLLVRLWRELDSWRDGDLPKDSPSPVD